MTFAPATTGPANPSPTGRSQTLRGPDAGHELASGAPVYVPFRSGPRNCGQSAAALSTRATHSQVLSKIAHAGRIAAEDTTSYTRDMRKAVVIVAGALAIVAAVFWQLGGSSISRDGSGIWPRLFSSEPNYDALEADRLRQREQGATRPTVPESSTEPATVPSPPVASASAASPIAEQPASPALEATAAIDWPDFRGAGRDGRYDTPIRTNWPSGGLPLLWKQPIGLGYASFVAADGRAFTIEQRRREEVVAAYDVETGRELWTHGWEAEFVESMGGDGPRATPTYHEGRVYALGATGELRSLDARSGSLIWRRNILTENGATNLDWGMAAAPLIVDDKVVVLPGGPRGKSVVAYDRLTGAPVWSSLDDRQAYTSPMLVIIGAERQILVVSALRVMGITVNEGRLLWDYPWVTDHGINAAQPLLLGDDRVFISAGYGHGAAVFQVGREGDRWSVREIWQNNRMKNKFTSSVLHGRYIYGLDEAILACVDADTGEQKWKGGRYGYGQILLAGDHVIVLTEDGDLALVRATPERHEEIGRWPAISGKTWNHPIVAGGRLLVRNLREMAAFDIRP
jgi:outer membrane protein assembly factor BamB